MAVNVGKTITRPNDSPYFYKDAKPATLTSAGNKGNAINDLKPFARGLYVGGAGNVIVVTSAGTEVTFNNVPAGAILPICVSMVLDTSTATNILLLL